ncbi:MAG: NAD-dependent epimerase/dehydratase family protein [Stackebrandtia sp.]
MHVLVTGASGTIGGAVTRALLRRGDRVTAVVTAADRPIPDGAEPLVDDLFDPLSLGGVLAGVDAAVHAASSNDENAAKLDNTVVDVVLRAFTGTSRPLVYTSGMWLHGDTGDVAATEDSRFAPPAMLAWRPDVERRLADAAEHAHTVRIRPGLVYGGGHGYIPMVLAPSDGVVRHFGDGGNRWSTVHADDLAQLYALALTSAPAGSVYLGVNEGSVRVAEVARAIAARHGAEVEPWPREQAEVHWGMMVDAFLLDQVATAAHARDQLGWRTSRPGLIEAVTERAA